MIITQRKYSQEETRVRIRQWCDKAERSHWDTRNKLIQWGIRSSEREELIAELIQNNLLNEERFAEAFASDHFRFYRWGSKKIEVALRKKGVSSINIQRALKKIPIEDCRKTMQEHLTKKNPQWKRLAQWQKKIKAIRFLLSKGYHPEESAEAVERFFR
ncbi:MAG: RecX family transcriptional regulator [Crocinitomicaceae bacterium]|nr:RecX family transcriptional regulator [Crocinitomicaceae bacterium]